MYVHTFVSICVHTSCAVILFCIAELYSLHDKTKTFYALCRKDKTALREHQYNQLCQVLYIILVLM